ncbi:acetyl/propionyl/methylcrotonyl-CoA carboxylase subunit alpha [Aestuariirhabdus litorea]|uniref:Biotin carboxylase n=1 Tax=Aestuariirhabdus litorea TaxID=2528527 RepID=A0A3P3VQK9_9GAMM|nr:acetyl/propionyl/methylcrotonyl-CoA carboxylase subunit alpha [Aestuariirhabdus litorea]RRJ84617.1 acetyl/propionyl/methylcrotonyl-CoA carboxylase subunit alpha [Aestuariirhabdus litorea]RWW97843.1 acetyl-CoA carboxylase biotin carboxylase subunit [Endozoicomonadaceae bacterium GTF-13]
MPTIEKLLVANRGEIAVRVLRTARELGYRTVAVYSEADRHSLHVNLADEAFCIGAGPVQESYLNADAILRAAEHCGANAIHPGYGFLSENSDFAQRCQDAGLIFIGPSSAAIELMGSKRRSKIAMIAAGVPCIPGYEGEDQSPEALLEAASGIGYPLMIKASAGGGGRGMRLVLEPSQLAVELERAASEAQSAFGSGELILEKAVIAPRHIEIQVFGDQQGNVIYLGERDCSVQRRHQKVVEEAPSPFVDESLRQQMGEAAVLAAKACNYVGAGTVEFLVDADRNFYFLEMNTRLQVEHPVTELVTGTDLVEWQLRVAEGHSLPLLQSDVRIQGHAIEVRLYAEDPAQNYLPQTGTVERWIPACFEGVRIDHNLKNGSLIPSFYDSMQAKVICWGETREIARRKLVRALEETQLFGLTTNKGYLRNILCHPRFAAGEATTAFIETDFASDPSLTQPPPPARVNGLAALLFMADGQQPAHYDCWHSAAEASWQLRLYCSGQEYSLQCSTSPTSNRRVVHNQQLCDSEVAVQPPIEFDEFSLAEPGVLEFVMQGHLQRVPYFRRGNILELEVDAVHYRYENRTQLSTGTQHEGGDTCVRAPMEGSLTALMVAVGDLVQRGQTLAIVEAMKMEHPLKASMEGVVTSIRGEAGDQVKTRQVLIELADSP